MRDRELDVTVFGATGFAGRLTAEHLARCAPPGTRVGLAGRSAGRLAAVRDDLGAAATGWTLLTADSADSAALAALAARTTAVATTVGPYDPHGLPLVRACAEAGTHYADLTGEVLFVRAAIDQAHDVAQASGARIVTACGFDSVPSDLGVLALADRALADGAGTLLETTLALLHAKGGFSGGTIASLQGQLAQMRDRAARRTALDPYALSRTARPSPTSDPSASCCTPDATRSWVAGWRPSSWRATTRGSSAARTHCSSGATAGGCATAR